MLLLSRFRISGHSMEPAFHEGEIVFVSGISYLFSCPKIGDVVAYIDASNTVLIKRIQERKETKYFLVGDNAEDSRDSRQLGWVDRQQIIGKVIRKL